jgi:hypothetical protein
MCGVRDMNSTKINLWLTPELPFGSTPTVVITNQYWMTVHRILNPKFAVNSNEFRTQHAHVNYVKPQAMF